LKELEALDIGAGGSIVLRERRISERMKEIAKKRGDGPLSSR